MWLKITQSQCKYHKVTFKRTINRVGVTLLAIVSNLKIGHQIYKVMAAIPELKIQFQQCAAIYGLSEFQNDEQVS
jgi:hypothetical protein